MSTLTVLLVSIVGGLIPAIIIAVSSYYIGKIKGYNEAIHMAEKFLSQNTEKES